MMEDIDPKPEEKKPVLEDPIKRGHEIEGLVCRDDSRLYYDFTCSGDYGGSVKACAVGCNLKCSFCWSIGRDHPEEKEFSELIKKLKHRSFDFPDPSLHYRFYTPAEAVEQMIQCAKGRIYSNGLQGLYEKEYSPLKEPEKEITVIGLSGGEATLGQEHLIGLLKELKRRDEEQDEFYTLIIHTNGMLFGDNPALVDEIKEYSHFVTVRVSLKAGTPELLSKFTGVEPHFFEYPFNAIKKLFESKIITWAAIIDNPVLFPKEGREEIKNRLESIDHSLVERLEHERLAFGGVDKREELFWQEYKRREK